MYNVNMDKLTITEVPLSGPKIAPEVINLTEINKLGLEMYEKNKELIKSKVPQNWFAVIEPQSAILIASPSQLELFNYTSTKYPNKLFFVIGLLQNQFINNASSYR